MKLIWPWTLVFLLVTASGRGLSQTEFHGSTAIRVLLDRAGRSAALETPGETLYVKIRHPGPWVPVGKRVHLDWNDKTQRLSLKGATSTLVGNLLYVRGGAHAADPLDYAGRSYRGLLKFSAAEDGWLTVNILPLEEYLAGTLASEMSAAWAMEALKAQAVASRTYALYMANHPKNDQYDLMKTTEDQVYSGASAESVRIRQALDATRGEYLAGGEGPAKVFFHARCGGSTEPEQHVWNQAGGNHVTVTCPYCRTHPFAWKFSVDFASLLSAVNLPKALTPPKLTAVQTSPTGRIRSLKLDSGGKSRVLDGNTLRSLLGYQRLKSTHFHWKTAGGEIHFSGVGSGHGVGMCQWGAFQMAKEGKHYRQILAYFYPQLSLRGVGPQALRLEAQNR